MKKYFLLPIKNMQTMSLAINAIVLFILISCTSNLYCQVVDFSEISKGIIIPRMTEADRNNMKQLSDGLLLYQTNGEKGFYFYDGLEWIKMDDIKSKRPRVFINGMNPLELGLFFVGPTIETISAGAGYQFVNEKGYRGNIGTHDRLFQAQLYFTESNSCANGKVYVSSSAGGRGYTINRNNNDLLYIPKEAEIIDEINYKSTMFYIRGLGINCTKGVRTARSVFEAFENDPTITGITLNVQEEYRVSFEGQQ